MEDGIYTLKEVSEGLGWAEWAIKDAIRTAFPSPVLHRDQQPYDVVRLKNGMFQVKYNIDKL
jgi:hypothetical protein